MPRDLASSLAKEATVEAMPKLNRDNAPDGFPPEITTSPEAQYDDDDLEGEGSGGSLFGQIADQRNEKRDQLHPYTQTLTLNDIESCVRLEEATFPENERCSREKVSLPFIILRLRCYTPVPDDKQVARCAACSGFDRFERHRNVSHLSLDMI